MPDRVSDRDSAGAVLLRKVMVRTPLRLRIIFWVVAIFGLVQITLSLLIILYQREQLQERNERRLAEAAQVVAQDMEADPDVRPSDFVIEQKQLRWFGRIAIISTRGADAINIAGPFGEETFASLRQAVAEGHFGSPGRPASGRAVGFYFASHPFKEDGRIILAMPFAEANAPLRTITLALLLLLPAGLAASAVSAWYVAGLAVRPIRQVQHFAEELTAENVQGSLDLEDSAPELESLREELGLAMRRIQAGYDAQARFLANISHEIKTPISVVQTEGEVLLAGSPSEEEFRAFTHTTIDEMGRLGRMVESFLLLTRVRQGKGTVQAQRHSVNDILMEAIAHCAPMARQYAVRLEPTLYDGDADPQVEGNAELLTTAMSNLIRNAIRFTPRDRPIRISCDVRGKRVALRVRDFGPGVPPEVLEHLFEPFTQSNSERRRGRGTGLGLQIAHGIAELHAGEVRVRNLKEGCEFSLRLKLVQESGNATSQDEDALT
jgi:signal transduction histidine kinase